MGFDYRTSTGLGKQPLGGHKQNLVCTGTQEKGAVTPQETESDLPVWVSGGDDVGWVAALGSGALNTTVLALALLKEVIITATTPTMVRPQAKLQGGNTALPINSYEHWGTNMSLRPWFYFFEPMYTSGIAGSYYNSMFNFLKSCCISFL